MRFDARLRGSSPPALRPQPPTQKDGRDRADPPARLFHVAAIEPELQLVIPRRRGDANLSRLRGLDRPGRIRLPTGIVELMHSYTAVPLAAQSHADISRRPAHYRRAAALHADLAHRKFNHARANPGGHQSIV